MNIGHSSRAIYDDDYYDGYIRESTGPINHRISTDRIYNCNGCLETGAWGPSNYGVSTVLAETRHAESQYLTDIDSILSNRNVKLSKSTRAKNNPIDVTKMKLYDKKVCGRKMNPENTLLSYPKSSYRGMGINRFYDTIHNAQDVVFWDFAVNTRLEAKDNFIPEYPVPMSMEGLLPKEDRRPVAPIPRCYANDLPQQCGAKRS